MSDFAQGSGSDHGSIDMRWRAAGGQLRGAIVAVALVASALLSALPVPAQESATPPAAGAVGAAPVTAKGAESFDTPEQAADAMVDAADRFDIAAIGRLLGPGQNDVVLTGDDATDRARARAFAAQAHEQKRIYIDPQTPTRAILLVGKQDWPCPVPIVKRHGKWSFDATAGRV